MKILITGGAGFVGRRFCAHYLKQDNFVECVDSLAPLTGAIHPDLWPIYKPLSSNFHFSKTDCRDFFRESEEKYDLVIHLAAMVGGRLMIEEDPLAVADDLSIDAQFYKWCTKTRPKKIVYFSSSASYPVSLQSYENHTKLKESDITFDSDIGMPDLTYGWSKLTGEYLGKLAHSKYDLDVVSFRPFSGYGEDQDLSYPFPAICKRAIDSVINNEKSFFVWGSGLQQRDFIHIDDCVKGATLILNKVNDGSAVNLSTGKPTSFIDLAKLILKKVGVSNLPIVTQRSKPEVVFARYGDTKMQNDFGFVPSISLDEGINKSIAFLKLIK